MTGVIGDVSRTFLLAWDKTTAQARRTWNDLQWATEFGAYGIATLLVHALTDLTVMKRSCKGTGFDFCLCAKDDEQPLFQGKARLEVSGILDGDSTLLQARARQKLRQTAVSNGTLPAYVIVVEFSEPCSLCSPPKLPEAITKTKASPDTGAKLSEPSTVPSVEAKVDSIVYVTRTGSKYHRAGCTSLSKSQIPMTLSEAVKRYAPCSICKPPTLDEKK